MPVRTRQETMNRRTRIDAGSRGTLAFILFVLGSSSFAQQNVSVAPADRKRCDAIQAQEIDDTKRWAELDKEKDKACAGVYSEATTDDHVEEWHSCTDAEKRASDFLENILMKGTKSRIAESAKIPGCSENKFNTHKFETAPSRDTEAEETVPDAQTSTQEQAEALGTQFDAMLDEDIGFRRRELAILKQLQTWYEVN